jgi:hypothetical protein
VGDRVASDGNVLWGPIELGGTSTKASIAYDNGLIFSINYDGQLTAFEAVTGDKVADHDRDAVSVQLTCDCERRSRLLWRFWLNRYALCG